ncbi:unnamed protein product [Nyctereutes procyonoides]|uniref:(raccoon dog) hypothetical protein n=1 Tax=Nyctereutes procyonoides TaxID=34880 RepID=A0A811ZF14_NYCPR|nr:unnamed protein product [Nyctereutes procyonoides]
MAPAGRDRQRPAARRVSGGAGPDSPPRPGPAPPRTRTWTSGRRSGLQPHGGAASGAACVISARPSARAPRLPGGFVLLKLSLLRALLPPTLEQDVPRTLPYADRDALEIKDKDGSGTGTPHPSSVTSGASRGHGKGECVLVSVTSGPGLGQGRPSGGLGHATAAKGSTCSHSPLREHRPVTTPRGTEPRENRDVLEGPPWTGSTEAGRGGRVGHRGAPNGDPNSRALGPLSKYPEKYHPIPAAAGPSPCPRTWRGRSGRRAPADALVGICARSAGLAPIHTSRLSGKRHIRWSRSCCKLMFTSCETRVPRRPAWKGPRLA